MPTPEVRRPTSEVPPPTPEVPRPTSVVRRPTPDVQTGAATPPKVTTPATQMDRPVTATIPAAPAGGVNTVPTGADKPEASPAVSGRGAVVSPFEPEPNRTLPVLLKDPVPRITAILVSNERRFATVNEGQILGIGDVIGKRIVVAIDDRAVVLREPSGVQIRVGLGGRILGVEAGR